MVRESYGRKKRGMSGQFAGQLLGPYVEKVLLYPAVHEPLQPFTGPGRQDYGGVERGERSLLLKTKEEEIGSTPAAK